MFHLFNKVYVEYDQRIDINVDRIVISERNGVPMHKALEDVSYGYLFMHGRDMQSFLEANSMNSFDDLIEWMYHKNFETNKRIMVYLDENAYKQFITLWFKRIFADIDASTAWKVVESYLRKDLRERGLVEPDVDRIYSGLNEESFTEAFLSYNHSDDEGESYPEIYASITPHLSLEFLVASYLHNGNFVGELCSSLKNILLRSLQGNALEVKEAVYRHYDKEPFKSKIDLEFFKKSTVFKSEYIGDVGSTSTVNLLTSTKADINRLKTFSKIVYLEWDQFTADSSVVKLLDMIDIVRSGITPENVDTILEFEKTSTSNNRIYADVDEDKINTYLLHEILNDYDSSTLEKLLLK